MKMFFGNNQQCYGLNISCTPSTLYLTLIRLICLCLCLFMSVPMSVFVCVCFQSDECGVHNCISNTHRAHESPVTIYGHFPLSPLTEGSSQSKNYSTQRLQRLKSKYRYFIKKRHILGAGLNLSLLSHIVY